MNHNDNNHVYVNKVLNRFDHYIKSTNNKAAFIIAFNTFVLSSLILRATQILNLFKSNDFMKIIVISAFFAIIIGVFNSLKNVFKAVMPYLKSGYETEDNNSLLFFGSIADMNKKEFINKINEVSHKEMNEDFIIQIHTLAKALNMKYKYIRKSLFWIRKFVLIPLLLILFLAVLSYSL
ncbi:Pycsar system effector family protein [Halarsenatibacter silvermanii]|uniref:Pycsar effector protein domain-containing protein n=1 Tax=Halarsenatibacter silvermanii TaxID=321763 RepID=A0A1G9RBI8_9FIRM|nr:Pycsar system effector family protein [Halarsenatibacter silvermanii]SDM20450.1 hypothetical protein SAMN04488692_12124 [Halarsenatibacter silvermanii]